MDKEELLENLENISKNYSDSEIKDFLVADLLATYIDDEEITKLVDSTIN